MWLTLRRADFRENWNRLLEIIDVPTKIQGAMRDLSLSRKTIGLVPTMGALHEAHASLIRQARQENDIVIVSVFVNPTQFGPSEDFSRYPRAFEEDCQIAEAAGADIVFAPAASDVYPEGFQTYVSPGDKADRLEGASRPGHFNGVATIVLKLFNLTQPTRAYFGCKDYQQLKIIQQMVKDFDLPIEIVPVPTVREVDGLAMSSRNRYLSQPERLAAVCLVLGLRAGQDAWANGERDPQKLQAIVQNTVTAQPLARVDYVAIVDPETLEDAKPSQSSYLIVLAVYIGKTRLIDNVLVEK